MSCGNIKLVGYNNLNNIIIKEHGSNNADYYSLIAIDRKRTRLKCSHIRLSRVRSTG